MDKLPDGAERLRELVKRSSPRRRPRLPDEYEDRLLEVDREMAATYASMEDLSDRLEHCIESLDEQSPVVRHISHDDSLAVYVEDLADESDDARSERLPMICAVGERNE
jgi:hypothetical protein